ncbi:MAG: hypothetical protein LBQ12_11350 [Deltaproteobacteria bacterium]|jgi:hypothetical protein|nr:hypothetical protein [Deltaproteobacteria bacterium]
MTLPTSAAFHGMQRSGFFTQIEKSGCLFQPVCPARRTFLDKTLIEVTAMADEGNPTRTRNNWEIRRYRKYMIQETPIKYYAGINARPRESRDYPIHHWLIAGQNREKKCRWQNNWKMPRKKHLKKMSRKTEREKPKKISWNTPSFLAS